MVLPWNSLKHKFSVAEQIDIKKLAKEEVAEYLKATIADGYYIVEDDQKRRSIIQVCHTDVSEWITSSNFAPDMSIKEGLAKFRFLRRINLEDLTADDVLVT